MPSQHWDRLLAETRLFQETLFASTLPPVAMDAIAGNLAILKSPTVLRLEDGTFYGWEGLHPTEGCCEGSCTHVWNYQQTLPFLFPALERSMRTADYKYNLRPDGGMPFRIQLPLGAGQWDFRPAPTASLAACSRPIAIGRSAATASGCAELWPAVKQSLEFAWNPANEDRWDPEMTGVLWGRQHHTLDMELFGPNSWLTGMYLGALKAGAEMAEYVGDQGAAEHYRAMFARGKAWADANLFNGEYYVQRIDLGDRIDRRGLCQGRERADGRLDHGSLLGRGAQGDQVPDRRGVEHRPAAGAVARAASTGWARSSTRRRWPRPMPPSTSTTSFPSMGDVYNPCRIYCLNDEGGLVDLRLARGRAEAGDPGAVFPGDDERV